MTGVYVFERQSALSVAFRLFGISGLDSQHKVIDSMKRGESIGIDEHEFTSCDAVIL